jgi:hypothetical protein
MARPFMVRQRFEVKESHFGRFLKLRGSGLSPAEACGKRGKTSRNAVDFNLGPEYTWLLLEVPFCWTGGYAL